MSAHRHASIAVLIAVLTSMLLTGWSVWQEDLLNKDGVFYIQVAKHISGGNWLDAFGLYHWLMYPSLAALVFNLTGFDLEVSFYLINGIFQALCVVVFIGILRQLGAKQSIVILGAICILIFPSFNEYRSLVVRGHGYWAFYLVSIYLLIQYLETPSWVVAILWSVSAGMATSFRVEGLLFWMLMPTVVVFVAEWNWVERTYRLFQLSTLALVIVFVLTVFVAVFEEDNKLLMGHLVEPYKQANLLLYYINHGVIEKADTLKQFLFDKYTDQYALRSIFAIMVMIFVSEVVGVLSLQYSAVAGYALYKRQLKWPPVKMRVILLAATLNVLLLIAYMLKDFEITGRWVMPLAFTLLLLVPYGINALWEQWRGPLLVKRKRVFF